MSSTATTTAPHAADSHDPQLLGLLDRLVNEGKPVTGTHLASYVGS